MTGTAAASKEADTATRLPLIEGIMADLAATNLSAVQLPRSNLCSHFVVIGPASDYIKRLLILRNATQDELTKIQGEAVGSFLSAIFGGAFDTLKDVSQPGDEESGVRVSRRLDVLNAMLSDALDLAYPEHAMRKLRVSHDGMLGYIDHSGLMEEAMRDMKAEIESGTFDFSPYPPEAVAAIKAGEYVIERIGETAFALRVRKRAPATN